MFQNLGTIYLEKRVVKVDTFPIGVDIHYLSSVRDNPESRDLYLQIRENFSGKKIILSVDRLDYTKGIYNRLLAYERFLEENRDWAGKVVLYIVVVPSRTDVEHYQKMKRWIDELVGRINGKFGSSDWVPVIYHYKFLKPEHLVGLYNSTDIALVTPIRDGMNLVAKEYIASRSDNTGVLILSEMAGASHELGEAIIVNPNNIEEMVEAIRKALEMPVEEQQRRVLRMKWRVNRYNVFRWGEDFVKSLIDISEFQQKISRTMYIMHRQSILTDYKNGRKRVIFLDYDGTLVPFVTNPDNITPDKELLDIITKLSVQKNTSLYIISGRPRHILDI
ncbi:MAG: trehalose-6-phosphate synthase [Myxococcota bacterium]